MRSMKPLPDPDLVLHPAWRTIALGIVVVLFASLGMGVALVMAAAGALGAAA